MDPHFAFSHKGKKAEILFKLFFQDPFHQQEFHLNCCYKEIQAMIILEADMTLISLR